MFLVDIVEAHALDGRRLSLTFSDGMTGTVALDGIVGEYDGVFADLLDEQFFSQVQIDPELGTVVWPNGADLCPDVLYAHATGQLQRLTGLAA